MFHVIDLNESKLKKFVQNLSLQPLLKNGYEFPKILKHSNDDHNTCTSIDVQFIELQEWKEANYHVLQIYCHFSLCSVSLITLIQELFFFFYLAEKCFIICKKVCTIRSLLKQYFNIKLENIIDFGSVVNRRTSVIRAQFSWFYSPVHRS